MEAFLRCFAEALVWYASTPLASVAVVALIGAVLLRDANAVHRLRLRIRYWRLRRALRRSLGR